MSRYRPVDKISIIDTIKEDDTICRRIEKFKITYCMSIYENVIIDLECILIDTNLQFDHDLRKCILNIVFNDAHMSYPHIPIIKFEVDNLIRDRELVKDLINMNYLHSVQECFVYKLTDDHKILTKYVINILKGSVSNIIHGSFKKIPDAHEKIRIPLFDALEKLETEEEIYRFLRYNSVLQTEEGNTEIFSPQSRLERLKKELFTQ